MKLWLARKILQGMYRLLEWSVQQQIKAGGPVAVEFIPFPPKDAPIPASLERMN